MRSCETDNDSGPKTAKKKSQIDANDSASDEKSKNQDIKKSIVTEKNNDTKTETTLHISDEGECFLEYNSIYPYYNAEPLIKIRLNEDDEEHNNMPINDK